ncbi:MAG TPA: hypothetical protein VF666_13605 [Pyrinomonadaceae bacterium]|jgi:hypothetical protein
MTVALQHNAMRLSEIITIYLAAAAPVGVAYFLRHHLNQKRARLLARAAVVAFAWPFTIVAGLLEQRGSTHGSDAETRRDGSNAAAAANTDARVEVSKRASIDALYRIEDLVRSTSGARDEKLRQVMLAARECTERFVGLALAARETDADAASPSISSREMELCRVAGRKGDDLLVAARCIRRRNVARLLAHHERARTELLHALAKMRETCGGLRFAAETDALHARSLSKAVLEALSRAIELFSALDDERAAMSAARLLDAECARLRRLENPFYEDARRRNLEGETTCPPKTSTALRSPIEHLPQPTT